MKLPFFLTYLLLFLACEANSQQEVYSNLRFNNASYHVFVIRAGSELSSKSEILRNDDLLSNAMMVDALIHDNVQAFLINASVSDSTCNPVGWLVNEGQTLHPPNYSDGFGNFYLKPNGALIISDDDISISESSEIPKYTNVKLAVQSGPLLLNQGTINPQFNSASTNMHIRCGAGTYKNSQGETVAVFAMANTPVTFYDFAYFFKKRFKCTQALCLESQGCGIYFPNIQLDQHMVYQGVICNYLVIRTH